MKDEYGRCFIQGSWMYIDDKDSLSLTKYGTYEPDETDLIKKIIRPEYIVLDIGANIGYYTLLMAKQVKQVFAFEPEQRNFELLQKNIDLNKLDNVDPRNVAASANSGKSTLYLCESNRGMHRLYKSEWCDEGVVTVQTI